MCLAIPMKIQEIKGEFARVASGRLTRSINIQMLPQLKAGDYVLVHAGFAIQRLDPEKAKETLRLIDEPRPSLKSGTKVRKEERGEIR